MRDAGSKPLHRAMTFSALAVLLGVLSLALAQCTMTGDNITGVGLDRSEPTTCVKQCNDQYALLFKQEQKTHDANVEKCQALEDNQAKADCLAAEDARHQQAKADLTAGKTACQNDCHHQGVGSAG